MIEDNVLKIKYPSGHMHINIDKFFPATLDRADKVFRLMRDHSPEEDIEGLYIYLQKERNLFDGQQEHYARQVATLTEKRALREAKESLRVSKRLYQRTKRNIELLEKITKIGGRP